MVLLLNSDEHFDILGGRGKYYKEEKNFLSEIHKYFYILRSTVIGGTPLVTLVSATTTELEFPNRFIFIFTFRWA